MVLPAGGGGGGAVVIKLKIYNISNHSFLAGGDFYLCKQLGP